MEANGVSMQQAIDLASVARASALAELLSADQQLAAAIADWNAQLVGTASELAITLEARDVRTLLPTPIAALQDVLRWVQPRVLLNYGELDPAAVRARALVRGCGGLRRRPAGCALWCPHRPIGDRHASV